MKLTTALEWIRDMRKEDYERRNDKLLERIALLEEALNKVEKNPYIGCGCCNGCNHHFQARAALVSNETSGEEGK